DPGRAPARGGVQAARARPQVGPDPRPDAGRYGRPDRAVVARPAQVQEGPGRGALGQPRLERPVGARPQSSTGDGPPSLTRWRAPGAEPERPSWGDDPGEGGAARVGHADDDRPESGETGLFEDHLTGLTAAPDAPRRPGRARPAGVDRCERARATRV